MPDNDAKDSRESTDEVEERTRTVLDFSSGVDLKDALSEAFRGKKKDVLLPHPDSDPVSEKRMNSVQVGCFGDLRCSPKAVSNINNVRIISHPCNAHICVD